MATNEPFVPSMIFKSRTTKALSNVTEQKACNRSLFSSTSLMRTSVMTTAVLLFRSVAASNATPDHSDVPPGPARTRRGVTLRAVVGRKVWDVGTHRACHANRVGAVATQGENRRSAARHEAAGRPRGSKRLASRPHLGAQLFRRGLQPVVQEPADLVHVAPAGCRPHGVAGDGRFRHSHPPEHVRRRQSDRGTGQDK